MTQSKPTTSVLSNADSLAQAVAERLVHLIASHYEATPFTIALSGGSTPKRLYQQLAQEPYKSQIEWSKVAFYFGDERSVPPEASDSNFRMAREALLEHIPSAHYRMIAESGKADDYSSLLAANLPTNKEGVPTFNVVLLGIGTDGHTASLFPGTQALQEQSRWAVMNDVPQLDTRRMTLTYPVINAAHHIWVLASGTSKQPIVAGVFSDSESPDWPICDVKPAGGSLHWWLDTDAVGETSLS